MLIAFMSDTFGKVKENEERSSMDCQLNILSDFRLLLKMMNLNMNFQYILIVKPIVELENEKSMDDKLKSIHDSFAHSTKSIMAEQQAWKIDMD